MACNTCKKSTCGCDSKNSQDKRIAKSIADMRVTIAQLNAKVNAVVGSDFVQVKSDSLVPLTQDFLNLHFGELSFGSEVYVPAIEIIYKHTEEGWVEFLLLKTQN